MQILSRIGVDLEGPFMVLADIDAKVLTVHRIEGESFTLIKHPERYCVGSHDLATKTRSFCSNRQLLLVDYKDTSCPACNEKTGFNPSFYNGGGLSSQQRAYNECEHIVYLAYFSPQHLKVGITSNERGIRRLLEQGARSAMLLKKCETAYVARELEARLCSTPGIYESLRGSAKYRLLTSERHNPVEAAEIMQHTVRETFRLEPTEPLNLDTYYGRDRSIFTEAINAPDNPSDTVLAGQCVGAVGDIVLMRQSDRIYALPLKQYVSHRVDYLPDLVQYEYTAPHEQISLF